MFRHVIGDDSKPVVGAEVRSAAKNWRGRPRFTDEQGRFNLALPKNAPSELLIFSSDWAPRRIAILPGGVGEIGDIQLHPGTKVSGKVLSEDGRPIAGQVVAVESTEEHASFYAPVRLFKKTDKNGAFEFPALKGEFKVLCPQWSGSGYRTQVMMSARPFVAVTPQIHKFDGTTKRKKLTLRAGPQLQLSGKIITPDGKAAQGVRVLLSAAIGDLHVGMASTPLQWTKTDEEGRYVLEGIPDGLQHASVHLMLGKWKGKAVVAGATHPTTGSKRYSGRITFRPLNKSYNRLNFDMKWRAPVSTRTGPEWKEYFALSVQLRQGVIDKKEAAPRFIELAKKHRSHEVGVHALGQVCSIFGSMAPGVSEIDQARDKLLEMVTHEFLNHPDLSIVIAQSAIRNCDNSVYPRFERMLRTVLEKSPHRTVRGHACFHLAEFLEIRTWLKRLDEQSHTKMLQAAEDLKRQVITDFGDISHVSTKQPLSELAKAWSAYTAIGKTAPEIIGRDAAGKEFKLSDYRGNVVMLSFSGNWCAPCRKLYAKERELVEKYKDEPFVLLGVNSDRDVESLKESIEKGEVTWRTWWDSSTTGPISTIYRVGRWPTIYLLDKRGVVRQVLKAGLNPADEELLEDLLNDRRGWRRPDGLLMTRTGSPPAQEFPELP